MSKTSPNNIAVTAVICTYDRYDVLPAAIQSLLDQSLHPDSFEIIVVDNSPDHQQAADFGKAYLETPGLHWVVETTPGLSNARNVATNLAESPYVAFMDDDAIADPDWLAEIVRTFDSYGERAGVVGGRVEPVWDVPRPHWLHDAFLGHLSVVNWPGAEPRPIGEKEWLAGTNVAFRVEALKAVGGFLTHLGRKGGSHSLLSNEETDVANKLKERGYVAVYVPGARVGHRVEMSRLSQEWFRRRVAWQAVSDYSQDGARLFSLAPSYWKGVLNFVNSLPPRERSLRALYVPADSPAMFKGQMDALYNYTIALLSGFNGIEV